MLTVILLIGVLGLCIYLAVDSYRDRHPDERLWRGEYRRLLAGGASSTEAAAGATDAVWSRDYTERFRGKTVQALQRDSETGRWTVIFEDGTSLDVLLREETEPS